MRKLYILFIALTLANVACKDDFINLAPEDSPSGATYFKDEAGLRQALLATYNALRGLANVDYNMAEMRSDNTHYEDYTVNRGDGYVHRENIADFLDNAGNSYSANTYFACYTGIARANIVLTRAKAASIDEAVKTDIEAQAKFLRAYFYFKLVRYFGGVSLHLKEVEKADDAFVARSSAEEVYAQIIADAGDAVDQMKPPASFPQTGLATKGSATMLLAEVYMTLKRYRDAELLLKTLPGMGYQLLGNYEDVFSTSSKNSRESIFEVQYLQGIEQGQQSNFIYQFLPRSMDTQIITGVKTNNVNTGGYNIPTQDLIDAYEPGDKRLEASIGIAEGSYNTSLIFTFSAKKSVIDYTPAPGKVGVPYIKKFLHAHSNANNTNDNWPVYRYADALLLLAEALNEQNKAPEALPYLNQVRVPRSGLDAITEANPELLRPIIARERRVELAFENHRWHDLVRTGTAMETMEAFGNDLKLRLSYLPANAFQLESYMLLFPIPQSERELNPALTQNTGYEQ
ncbi:RagB/SusD family nutrient uptake outer membrane protein [Chitinophaga cymbidii]|uniref:Membrane protein n=1 Tax=Chitinophaga cymbidii TaxID=1096750 RepID=A0A512RSW9_9BACT|nr:RagB/SusD family nutrient uptake outer membrane protein [Chitinophaga cymbidii]GEP98788.1 membrane protein [Chitinophaga cymbidii]